MESLIGVLPAEFRPTARLSGYFSVAASAFAIPGLLYVSLYLTKSLMGVMHNHLDGIRPVYHNIQSYSLSLSCPFIAVPIQSLSF